VAFCRGREGVRDEREDALKREVHWM
jgi:hypothetical protein